MSTVDGTALAGSDYTAASGVLSFAAGVTQQQVVITITGDSLVENNESFGVTLGAGTGYTLTKATGTATINDDDVPSVSVSPASISERASPSRFTEGSANTSHAATSAGASSRWPGR